MVVLSWNLYHGRDHPPDPGLFTSRSRWLRRTEIGERYAQVNRSLRDEFARVLAAGDWEIALLQEAPPRWRRHLSRATGSQVAMALTSRNFGAPLRRLLTWLNPDLIGSDEGGSNQILARPPWQVGDTRTLELTRHPERRAMIFARLAAPGGPPVCVANLHASTADAAAGGELELAAERAVQWAGGDPLVLGGDFNVRPDHPHAPFDELASRFSFAPEWDRRSIDHLLVRGLRVVERPRMLPPEWREVPGPAGRLLRLSDHAPVRGVFAR